MSGSYTRPQTQINDFATSGNFPLIKSCKTHKLNIRLGRLLDFLEIILYHIYPYDWWLENSGATNSKHPGPRPGAPDNHCGQWKGSWKNLGATVVTFPEMTIDRTRNHVWYPTEHMSKTRVANLRELPCATWWHTAKPPVEKKHGKMAAATSGDSSITGSVLATSR